MEWFKLSPYLNQVCMIIFFFWFNTEGNIRNVKTISTVRDLARLLMITKYLYPKWFKRSIVLEVWFAIWMKILYIGQIYWDYYGKVLKLTVKAKGPNGQIAENEIL